MNDILVAAWALKYHLIIIFVVVAVVTWLVSTVERRGR